MRHIVNYSFYCVLDFYLFCYCARQGNKKQSGEVGTSATQTRMTLLLKPISEVFLFQSHFQHPRLIANFSSVSCCSDRESYKAQTMVREFDPKIPIEKALTPPSSWYSDPSFYAFELDRVFYRGWQAVG